MIGILEVYRADSGYPDTIGRNPSRRRMEYGMSIYLAAPSIPNRTAMNYQGRI